MDATGTQREVKEETGPKKNLGRRAGGVTQEVECLLSKCEALSSNPSTTAAEYQTFL
jgi:hypothetical protein